MSLYSECKAIIGAQKPENIERNSQLENEYNAWLQRKIDWDNGGWRGNTKTQIASFVNLPDVIKAIETMEVK